ncbi:SLATT domain-containing protein [Sphingobacterium sp.]|uniref:SLATT domain-containing protein n=1 Tax=Sphingobacterium sp. TaxID=341027 RepID=UPI00289BF6DA|nr:SLATT domain-containing protein [Sphingobacterium sp.]
MEKDEYTKLLNDYIKVCKYLKQINSNKAKRNSIYNNWLTIITLIFTVILTALAFIDKKVFTTFFTEEGNNSDKIKEIIELCFNGTSLVILILTLINLLYGFQQRSSNYFNSVITLSSVIREIENLIRSIKNNESDFHEKFRIIETKYNVILEYLPQHSDKDFLKAKYDLKVKDKLSEKIKNEEIPQWRIKLLSFKSLIFLNSEKKQ